MGRLLARNLKWIAAISAVLVVLGTASVTHAGLRWTGFDPGLELNGRQFNVRIEWDAGHTCDVQETIEIVVVVPKGSTYTLQGESIEDFDCDGDGVHDTHLETITTVVESPIRGHKAPWVLSRVESYSGKFRVRTLLYLDDELTDVCPGISGQTVKCKGPNM